ncbi:MAG: hypothetical protein WCW26_03410 [Candidatus Buchananbacteria bacterium]
MKNRKKLVFFLAIGLFLVALPLIVLAADAAEQTVEVGPDQIISGNFIKAGNIIDIKGTVAGDVIVAGNSITISGPVAGDVIAAGSMIRIKGPVSGSVRLIGNSIEVDSEVAHNAWALGNNVVIGSNAKVGWDVFSAASSLEIKGPVGGNVWGSAATVYLTNEIAKDVNLSLDKQGQMILSQQGKINGNLNYQAQSDKQLVIKDSAAVVGQISRKASMVPNQLDLKKVFGGAYLFLRIISLFSLLVIGLVVVTFFPKILLETKERMIKKPWPTMGFGLVYFIVVPIVAILLMCTIIGLPLALIIGAIYLVGLCISKVIVSFVIGLLVVNSLSPDKKYKGSLMWPMVLGVLIFVLIASLPVIGWIAKMMLVWLAFGALLQTQKNILRDYR